MVETRLDAAKRESDAAIRTKAGQSSLKTIARHFSLHICRMPVLLQEKLQQKPYEMQVCLLE